MSDLPFILLGIQTTIREDPDFSPSELVFCSPIRVPGHLLPGPTAVSLPPSTEFVKALQHRIRAQVPAPVAHHVRSDLPVHVPKSLAESRSVFVRVDAVKPPLTRPYIDLSWSQDFYTSERWQRVESVN